MSVLRHVRHAILAWPHAGDMGSVERWEELARHIANWVDNRKELPRDRWPTPDEPVRYYEIFSERPMTQAEVEAEAERAARGGIPRPAAPPPEGRTSR